MEVVNIRKDREYRGFKDLSEVGQMLNSMINQSEKFCY